MTERLSETKMALIASIICEVEEQKKSRGEAIPESWYGKTFDTLYEKDEELLLHVLNAIL